MVSPPYHMRGSELSMVFAGHPHTRLAYDLGRRMRAFDRRSLLKGLAFFSAFIERNSGNGIYEGSMPRRSAKIPTFGRVVIAQHMLALTAKVLLERGQDSQRKTIPYAAVLDYISHAGKMLDPRDMSATSQEDMLAFSVRIGWQQLPLQEWTRYIIPRGKLLFVDSAQMVADEGYDIEGEFQRITKLSIAEFMEIGALFYSSFLASGEIRLPLSLEPELQHLTDIIAPQKVSAFVAILSQPIEALARESRKSGAIQGFDMYGWNPLMRYPLVNLSNSWYAPVLPFFTQRISDGPFWLLDGAGRDGRFRTQFGFVFEQYLGLHLKAAFAKSVIYHEHEIQDTKGVVMPDWVVVNPDRSVVDRM